MQSVPAGATMAAVRFFRRRYDGREPVHLAAWLTRHLAAWLTRHYATWLTRHLAALLSVMPCTLQGQPARSDSKPHNFNIIHLLAVLMQVRSDKE